MDKTKLYTTDFGGRELKVTLVNWAEQTSGSVLMQYGETVMLATAVMSGTPREGIDFFPLLVDYQERFYASGKIKGSRFIKREGRPSDEATLTGRVIDRSIRPRFDMRIRNDVQVVVTVLSYDKANDPEIPSIIASSLALSLSDIPWKGPMGAVRVGKIDDKFVLNPTIEDAEKCSVLATISGSDDLISMIEVESSEADEKEVLEAFEFGKKYVKKIVEFQNDIISENGKAKTKIDLPDTDDELKAEVEKLLDKKLEEALFKEIKKERMDAVSDLKKEIEHSLEKKYSAEKPENVRAGLEFFEDRIDELVHKNILDKERRVDGRKLDELRSLSCEVGMLPRTHGSGLFMRGNTHVLGALTLGTPKEEQIIDEMQEEYKKRFMLHYNFPGFSVGEVSPMRSPSRRDIGHGALAEKALKPLIPSKEDFPYTIRIVSEILSSNGSSSMASVCAGSLCMMDGGVPIKRPAAGIAMGLMTDESGRFKVLTDIQGPEDHYGDMDLKIAGTRNGITAVQMDVKVDGVTQDMLEQGFKQAKKARLEILDVMESTIAEPRKSLSAHAPRILIIQINPEKIRDVIGPGGKVINGLIDETGVLSIDIEDDGKIYVAAGPDSEEGANRAISLIKDITREIKIGEVFMAKVVKIADFGAFVELTRKHEGLVHVSELSDKYVSKVGDVVKMGDTLRVRVIRIDEQGKIALSAKNIEPNTTPNTKN